MFGRSRQSSATSLAGVLEELAAIGAVDYARFPQPRIRDIARSLPSDPRPVRLLYVVGATTDKRRGHGFIKARTLLELLVVVGMDVVVF